MKLETLLQAATLVSVIGGGTYFLVSSKADFAAFQAKVDTKFEYVQRDISELRAYFEPSHHSGDKR